MMDDLQTQTMPIRILFGTVTGNSEVLAEETAEKHDNVMINLNLLHFRKNKTSKFRKPQKGK